MHNVLISQVPHRVLALFMIFLLSNYTHTVPTREHIQTYGQPLIYNGRLILVSCDITSLDGLEET